MFDDLFSTRELGIPTRSSRARSQRPTEVSYARSSDPALVDEYGQPIQE